MTTATVAMELRLADELAAFNREVFRRKEMVANNNCQTPCPFKIGDTVLDRSVQLSDEPDGLTAVVIGLPSRRARCNAV